MVIPRGQTNGMLWKWGTSQCEPRISIYTQKYIQPLLGAYWMSTCCVGRCQNDWFPLVTNGKLSRKLNMKMPCLQKHSHRLDGKQFSFCFQAPPPPKKKKEVQCFFLVSLLPVPSRKLTYPYPSGKGKSSSRVPIGNRICQFPGG